MSDASNPHNREEQVTLEGGDTYPSYIVTIKSSPSSGAASGHFVLSCDVMGRRPPALRLLWPGGLCVLLQKIAKTQVQVRSGGTLVSVMICWIKKWDGITCDAIVEIERKVRSDDTTL